MWSRFLVLLCILSCLSKQGLSLYEDQVGTYDWRQQYVGRPKVIRFDSGGHSTKRVIVATEQNVIASLNAKTGDIGWRQMFENSDAGIIDDMVLSKNYVVSVSAQGGNLRCFSSATGSLVWEHLDDITAQYRSVLSLLGSAEDSVALLSGGNLKVFDIETGDVQWTKELPNSDVVQYQNLFTQDDNLVVVGISPNSHVSLNIYHEGGVLKSQSSIPAAWTTAETSCVLVGGSQFVCLDVQSSTLQSVSLADPKVFKTTLLQDLALIPQQVSLIDIQWDKADSDDGIPVFGLRLGPSHVALLSADKAGIKVVKDLPGAAALQVLQSGEKQVLAAFNHKPSGSEIRFYDIRSGADLPDAPIMVDFSAHHGLPHQMFILTFRKKDGNTGYRALVLSEDHSIALIQQSGRISWNREEALSSVVSVEMVDLPVSPLLAKMEDEFGHTSNDDIFGLLIKRFATQFSQLGDFLHQLKNKLRTPRHSHRHLEDLEDDEEDDTDEEEYKTRDEFNLHKMIVIVSSAGKIFGVDNLTGRMFWRHYLPDIGPFTKYGQQTLPLLVQRTTAHFPHRPICTVVGRNKVTGQGLIYSFDPITGEPVGDMPSGGLTLKYNVLQLTTVSQLDEHFQHPLIILDTNLQYHVFPATATRVVVELAPVLYLFTTDVDAGMLSGYGMTVSAGDIMRADKLWSVNLLKEQQSITNVLPKRPTEHVHSQGIVLGDRSVMYKYLNPNLVVVTTEGVDNTQKTFLNLYLIDGVTGHIVFQCSHKRAKGPSRVVHSENWIVYTYWNQKLRRNEIAVLEMYEGTKQSNATAFSSLSPPPQPLVMRQAYIFPGHISSMAATITEKGITNKHILMALETGGILELPKGLLDPRRPEVLTQEHKEEGVMPYIPELPRPYEAIVNYNQTVFNIRGIHTSPAGLESTSLVLCYGLDLFYTRVTPSKMFDVLKEDFDYLFISSVLVGMILVSVITQKLAVRKALNRAWK